MTTNANSETLRSTGSIDDMLSRIESFGAIFDTVDLIGLGFVVLILLELVSDIARRKRRALSEPLANLSFQLVALLLYNTAYALVVVSVFALLEPFALVDIPITAWSWVLCLLAADFTYYWMHRAEHRVRLFWALHSVHHSSEEYDLSTSLRIFWLIDFSIVLFFAPLVLIGFSGPQVLGCMVVVFTYMIWVHTQRIGKLGWFDRFFSSPSVHRVHHGRNSQYIDKNYAGIFLIWDRLFGTHEPEVEPVRFGISHPVSSSNPLRIGMHEIPMLVRDIRRRRGWKNKFLTLVMPPDWDPS
ncbi:MAG: sterol desaturase family protein [Gammaproteobacteria bacterium]